MRHEVACPGVAILQRWRGCNWSAATHRPAVCKSVSYNAIRCVCRVSIGGANEMSTRDQLRDGISRLAKRSVGRMAFAATRKLHPSSSSSLVLPLIGLLGYDYSNRRSLSLARSHLRQPNKRDLEDWDGQPIIAIECKKVGANLVEARGQFAARQCAAANQPYPTTGSRSNSLSIGRT